MSIRQREGRLANTVLSSGPSGILNTLIPTEVALTSWALIPAAFGGLGQIIASRRLSQVSGGSVSVKQMILSILLTAGASLGGAFLVPTEGP